VDMHNMRQVTENRKARPTVQSDDCVRAEVPMSSW